MFRSIHERGVAQRTLRHLELARAPALARAAAGGSGGAPRQQPRPEHEALRRLATLHLARREGVLIDPSFGPGDALLATLPEDVAVLRVPPGATAAALARAIGTPHLDVLHVFCAGTADRLLLGGMVVAPAEASAAPALEALAGAFTGSSAESGPALQFYGCGFGEGAEGRTAAAALARALNASIAASKARAEALTEPIGWHLRLVNRGARRGGSVSDGPRNDPGQHGPGNALSAGSEARAAPAAPPAGPVPLAALGIPAAAGARPASDSVPPPAGAPSPANVPSLDHAERSAHPAPWPAPPTAPPTVPATVHPEPVGEAASGTREVEPEAAPLAGMLPGNDPFSVFASGLLAVRDEPALDPTPQPAAARPPSDWPEPVVDVPPTPERREPDLADRRTEQHEAIVRQTALHGPDPRGTDPREAMPEAAPELALSGLTVDALLRPSGQAGEDTVVSLGDERAGATLAVDGPCVAFSAHAEGEFARAAADLTTLGFDDPGAGLLHVAGTLRPDGWVRLHVDGALAASARLGESVRGKALWRAPARVPESRFGGELGRLRLHGDPLDGVALADAALAARRGEEDALPPALWDSADPDAACREAIEATPVTAAEEPAPRSVVAAIGDGGGAAEPLLTADSILSAALEAAERDVGRTGDGTDAVDGLDATGGSDAAEGPRAAPPMPRAAPLVTPDATDERDEGDAWDTRPYAPAPPVTPEPAMAAPARIAPPERRAPPGEDARHVGGKARAALRHTFDAPPFAYGALRYVPPRPRPAMIGGEPHAPWDGVGNVDGTSDPGGTIDRDVSEGPNLTADRQAVADWDDVELGEDVEIREDVDERGVVGAWNGAGGRDHRDAPGPADGHAWARDAEADHDAAACPAGAGDDDPTVPEPADPTADGANGAVLVVPGEAFAIDVARATGCAMSGTLSWWLVSGPPWAAVEGRSGLLRGVVPAASREARVPVTVTLANGTGAMATLALTLEIDAAVSASDGEPDAFEAAMRQSLDSVTALRTLLAASRAADRAERHALGTPAGTTAQHGASIAG